MARLLIGQVCYCPAEEGSPESEITLYSMFLSLSFGLRLWW